MPTLAELRSDHPRLIYKQSSWKKAAGKLEMEWHFRLEPDLDFRPKQTLALPSPELADRLSDRELDLYVFNIGMTEMLSYWKLAAPGEIVVEAGFLSQAQLDWWHDLLIQGMGEYFFVNQIDFTGEDFVKIVSKVPEERLEEWPSAETEKLEKKSEKMEKVLIPLGGGKDSVVTLELFRRQMDEGRLACLLINPTQAARDIARESDLETIVASRQLDPLLLELNSQGYLNGHVPISALFAFVSLLAARLNGLEYIAISNERSSNEGNVDFLGREINHQYSKTFEFERKFQQYITDYYPHGSPKYYSYVRPLFELQIGKIFSGMKNYHPLFRSCNVGQKTNSWCGQCPKCLFAFIILYPFMTEAEMMAIFAENLLDKPSLLPLALELMGVAEKKPLECVGTKEESLAAFHLCWQKSQAKGKKHGDLKLLDQVFAEVLSKEENLDARALKVLTSWNNEHTIPSAEWENWLREALS